MRFIINNKQKLLALLMGFTLLFSRPLDAQTLEDYLWEAAENNPGLRADYTLYQAKMEEVDRRGTLPNPELSTGFYLMDMRSLMGNQKGNLSVMQQFPWFGTLKLQKDMASKEAISSFYRFQTSKEDLFFEVKTTYYQIYLIHHHLTEVKRSLELLSQMEQLALERFKGAAPGVSGKLTDVLQVQSARKAKETKVAQLEDELQLAQLTFNLLLNRAEDSPVTMDHSFIKSSISYEKEAVLDSVLLSNPGLKELQADGEAYKLQGELAAKQGLPNFGLGLNYMINSARAPQGAIGEPGGYVPGGMGHNMVMPMVSISIPIYRKSIKAAKNQSDLYRQSSMSKQENLKLGLKTEVEEAFLEWRTANRNEELYRTQVELLEKTRELMFAAYSAGEEDFENLLTVHDQLIEFVMKMAEENVRGLNALAKIEKMMALNLEQ